MSDDFGTLARVAERERYARHLYRAPVIAEVAAKSPAPAAPGRPMTDSLIAENVRLKAANSALARKIEALTSPPADEPTIQMVQKAFCVAYREIGGEAAPGEPYTVHHLTSVRRSAPLSRPRQVCMALCRKLCVSHSLPTIGKLFLRDHTTVMHAVGRAPDHIANCEKLAAAHAKVLAQFKATP